MAAKRITWRRTNAAQGKTPIVTENKILRIAAIVVLLLAGVFAGTQLGKIAPLVKWYRNDLGFSLVLIGWLTSMIAIFVALVALPAGWAIELAGMRRSFVLASMLLVAGGLALAVLQAPTAILLARMVEGVGYLVLVIAIPAIASAVALPSWRAPVLAAWGGFVPVGFAAADFLAGWVLPAGPQIYLLSATVIFAILAGIAAALLARVRDWREEKGSSSATATGDSFRATLSGPVILVAVAFGIYVVLSVGFFTFMPAFIASGRSTILFSAGIVALLVPLGNFATSVLVRGRDGRFAAMLAAGGFGVTAAVAVPAFAANAAMLATAAIILLAVSGGVTASALFASVPFIVPRAGSASVAIGLIAQTGGFATVFGPPLAGHVIDDHAWTGFGWFIAAWAVIGIAILTPLLLPRRSEVARGKPL